jgi:hypothetical protein
MTADLDVADLDVAAAPRTRRSIIAGAIGGILAVVGVSAKPSAVRAGVDGDVVLDGTNNGAGTTQILTTASSPAVRVTGGTGVAIRAEGTTGRGLEGTSDSAVAVFGASGGGTFPAAIAASTGVYGISIAGHGVYGASDTGVGVYAANNASTVAAIVAEGGPGTAIHGHANQGPVPASPALTGIYGSAASTGVAVAGDSASGLAVRGTSSAGHGIRGRGALDGTIGESTAGRSGVVGFSGSGGAAPAGPAKTGVYGEATLDAASRGVNGFTLTGQGVRGEATTGQGVQGQATTGIGVRGNATTGIGVQGITDSDPTSRGVFGLTTSGQGVRGEATTSGIGVRAVSVTGNALDVSGRVKVSRSGIANVPANKDLVDVTVPGGIATTSMVFAVMQVKRTGVWVVAARPAWPSAGLLRIYLNKVGSTTAATPVAWFVLS